MTFKTAKMDLDAALNVVKNSLGSDGLEAHLVFRKPLDGIDNKVEVLTYSGRLCASAFFTASLEDASEANMFTIEYKRLNELLSALPDDAVLTFKSEDKVVDVSVVGRKAVPRYQSLDPEDFRFWDKYLDPNDPEAAKLVATLSSKRLASALKQARMFTSNNESRNPEFCVAEVKDGYLISTDNKTISFVIVDALKDSTLRIHYKDAGNIIAFLDALDAQVEVLEYPRGMFFRRSDGAVFGEGRFQVAFPVVSIPEFEDQYHWVLSTDKLVAAMKILKSCAVEGDRTLTIARPKNEGPVLVSMKSTTGKIVTEEITPLSSGESSDDMDFADEFDVDLDSLEKVLKTYNLDEIRVGLNKRKRGGYCRFSTRTFASDNYQGDDYQVFLRWLRSV